MSHARPTSTDGRCPECEGYKYSKVPGVWRRAICLICETVFIRLTGAEALRHRAAIQ